MEHVWVSDPHLTSFLTAVLEAVLATLNKKLLWLKSMELMSIL